MHITQLYNFDIFDSFIVQKNEPTKIIILINNKKTQHNKKKQKKQMSNKIFKQSITPLQKTDYKLQTSVNTNATSNHGFKNKPSLMCCNSSVSIEELENMEKFKIQRKLWMKFMINDRDGIGYGKILQEMREYYRNVQVCEDSLIFKNPAHALLYIPSKYPQEVKNMLQYFCGVWLLHMGYQNQKNKQMIIERVRLSLGMDKLQFGVLFYQKLGAGIINHEQRWQLIMGTCLNGWNYFSNKLIYYCSKNISQSNYNITKQ